MLVLCTLLAVALSGMILRRRSQRKRRSGERSRRANRGIALVAVAVLVGGQALLGLPAAAAATDCAPNPEQPGAGMVGSIDPAPTGTAGSVYAEVGYAGLTWHVYDPDCGGISSLTGSSGSIDTWVGNDLLSSAKVIVGATNSLHYLLLDGTLTRPLDDLVSTGSRALYTGVFAPLLGLAALVLALVLFRAIWRGDLAAIGRRTLWALAALWLASATYLTPLLYTQVLDEVLISGTNQLQAGLTDQPGLDQRNGLPTLLHTTIVYNTWLRGEFGDPDAPQAAQYGRDLVRAQGFTKDEAAHIAADQTGTALTTATTAKKQSYVDIRSKLGNATGFFDGTDGSRTGDGVLALVQACVFALFPLLAKATILLAHVVLRLVVLAGPLIGLAAIVFPDVLRRISTAAAAALLSVVVVSVLAGVDTLVLVWITDPAHGITLLPQMLLGGLVTAVAFASGRPLQRMLQMMKLSVRAAEGVRNSNSNSIEWHAKNKNKEPKNLAFWYNLPLILGRENNIAAIGTFRPEFYELPHSIDDIGSKFPSIEANSAKKASRDVLTTVRWSELKSDSNPGAANDNAEFLYMGTRDQWRVRNAPDSEIPVPPRKAGDSTLPNDCPVYHTRNRTAIGYDSRTLGNHERIRPLKGWHDVLVHGVRAIKSNGTDFEPGAINFDPGAINAYGKDAPLGAVHPNHIRDACIENPGYNGEPIRLLACHSATAPTKEGSPVPYALPLAQILANRIGRPVKAPTHAVGTDRYGEAIQDPQVYDGGRWLTFLPLSVIGE
jgi:hypothetical protein